MFLTNRNLNGSKDKARFEIFEQTKGDRGDDISTGAETTDMWYGSLNLSTEGQKPDIRHQHSQFEQSI
jgi:hypothetical protein